MQRTTYDFNEDGNQHQVHQALLADSVAHDFDLL
jgi:hypothetical protein